MTAADRAVAEARRWLGTPYVHQASTRGVGADCLGLLRGIWREVYGREPMDLGPYTADWAEAGGREEMLTAARALLLPAGAGIEPGDILIFRMRAQSVAKHLGIVSAVSTGPRFIHAYSGHGVVETALTEPWHRRLAARLALP